MQSACVRCNRRAVRVRSVTIQPNLSRVAAAIGDASRAGMLTLLLAGHLYTATELARHANVAASTASEHLKLLLRENLVQVTPRGRHRYYSLANGDVAHTLEALLHVAQGTSQPDQTRWQQPKMRALRYCRSCYGHLAGELGVWLCQATQRAGWVAINADDAGNYLLTDLGANELHGWGCKVSTQRRSLYSCVDWSERREHFAGTQAVEILDRLLELGWLNRTADSRAIAVTGLGRQRLSKALGILP